MNKNIGHFHGTCNLCGKRNILVVMFGYGGDFETPCYRICKNCFAKNIKQIIYGFHNYEDGLID